MLIFKQHKLITSVVSRRDHLSWSVQLFQSFLNRFITATQAVIHYAKQVFLFTLLFRSLQLQIFLTTYSGDAVSWTVKMIFEDENLP